MFFEQKIKNIIQCNYEILIKQLSEWNLLVLNHMKLFKTIVLTID
jgi:hypothetical protein